MKINNKVFLINFVILCLINCGGKQKTTDQDQTEKIISQNSGSSFVLTSGNYIVEPGSSSVFWECRWLGGNKHDGGINLEKGSVTIKNDNNITGQFVVDMNTIDCFDIKNIGTKNKLIGHLKSDAFFDVENQPKASLEIHSSENIGDNKFLFNGDFTIKGITNPIQMKGLVQDIDSGYNADIKLVFDRSKYNIRHRSASFFNDLGDRIISDDVFLNVNIIVTKQF